MSNADEQTRAIPTAEQRIAELEALVYVPGLWQCANCKFHLVQVTLHAANGAVTSRDKPGERCPNCHVPLWRVTERDAGNEMGRRCEALAHANLRLELALRDGLELFDNYGFADESPCVRDREIVANMRAALDPNGTMTEPFRTHTTVALVNPFR